MTGIKEKIKPIRPSLRGFWICLISALLWMSGKSAYANTCDSDHTVVTGESLSKIAAIYYDDVQKWSVIYNVNLSTVGENPNLILVGQKLRIPCLDNTQSENTISEAAEVDTDVPETEEAETVESENLQLENSTSEAVTTNADAAINQDASTVDNTVIRFLTADDYAPFTDRKLYNGGIVTDMLQTALSSNPENPQFVIRWVNDWSVHLNPLLTTHDEHDLGFPWLQPDCASMPDDYRCENFKFSNSIFEMLILLFTDKDRPISFSNDSDIEGAVLCRPNGYYTHDLEKDGRLWLTNNVIELKQPDSIKECFDLLTNGEVDAVALNEFTGRSAVSELELTEQVEVLENRPLSIEGLHVVVHKNHPRAQELIEIVNESMVNLQLSDGYNDIVDLHFREFWSKIE